MRKKGLVSRCLDKFQKRGKRGFQERGAYIIHEKRSKRGKLLAERKGNFFIVLIRREKKKGKEAE